MKTLREYLSGTIAIMPRNVRNADLGVSIRSDVAFFLEDGKSVLIEEKIELIGENEAAEKKLNYRHKLCVRAEIERRGRIFELKAETNLNSTSKAQHLFDAKRRIIGLIIKEWRKNYERNA